MAEPSSGELFPENLQVLEKKVHWPQGVILDDRRIIIIESRGVSCRYSVVDEHGISIPAGSGRRACISDSRKDYSTPVEWKLRCCEY